MTDKQSNFYDLRYNIKARINDIENKRMPISLVIDSITNPANAGMIFRIADAARLKQIIFFRPKFDVNSKKIKKYSRSCSEYVSSKKIEDENELKTIVGSTQFIALEKTDKSIPYNNFIPERELFIAVGSEKYGISKNILALTKKSLHLPALGVNTSINIATAISPVVFSLINKMT